MNVVCQVMGLFELCTLQLCQSRSRDKIKATIYHITINKYQQIYTQSRLLVQVAIDLLVLCKSYELSFQ